LPETVLPEIQPDVKLARGKPTSLHDHSFAQFFSEAGSVEHGPKVECCQSQFVIEQNIIS